MATTTITYQEFDRTITARESKRRTSTSTGHRIYMRQVRSRAVCALEEGQRKVPFFIDTCLIALFDSVEKYRRVGRSRAQEQPECAQMSAWLLSAEWEYNA